MTANLLAALAAVAIIAAAVYVLSDVRDRRRPPPLPRRVLDRYDADGRRIDP